MERTTKINRAGELAPSVKAELDRPLCGASLASDPGNHCKRTAGQNTPHPGYGYCSKHGGNTTAGLKNGARLAGRDMIQRFKAEDSQVYRFGGDRRDPSIATLSPELALVEEVRRSAAMVRFLEQRIGEWGLDIGDPALEQFVKFDRKWNDPTTRRQVDAFLASLDPEDPDSSRHLPPLVETHPDSGISSFTNKREWLYLYREERGHLARTAKMAIDAGVAQRLVSLAEDQGRILSSAIRAVLQALDLTSEQMSRVPVVVPAILRAVANDQPLPDVRALLTPTDATPALPASSATPYASR